METEPCSQCGEQISTDVRTCPECDFAPWKPLLALGILGPCFGMWTGVILLFLSALLPLALVAWGIGALTLLALPGALFAYPTD